MKRRINLIICLAIVITAMICCFAACSDKGDSVPEENNPTEIVTRTVEIICGDSRVVRVYEDGTEISLSADYQANQDFIGWIADGKLISTEREAKYVLVKDVVIRAIYASRDYVSLDACGGELPENAKITVVAYGSAVSENQISGRDGSLINGYGYILPVPEKPKYKFVCWKSDPGEPTAANRMTDENGASLKDYDGAAVTFYAEYSENPYVTLVTVNKDTGETVGVRKAYIEDVAVNLVAPSVTDRECIGWTTQDGDVYEDKGVLTREDEYRLELDKLTPGETYVFEAHYREAYKLTVIGGIGAGSYARDDAVELDGDIPLGHDFVRWQITVGETVYTLGRLQVGDKSMLCIINGDEVSYYSESEGRTVTVALEGSGAEVAGVSQKFLMGEIEQAGITISGTTTRLKAEYVRKEHTLLYIVDCIVGGNYCLSETGEEEFIAAGFVKKDGGVFEKEEYYNFNEPVTMSGVPTIPHYKFGNWSNIDTTAKLPSTMPDGSVTVRGTFVPDKHKVEVAIYGTDVAKGSVKIGAGSGTLTGYYDYGSTITITLTADSGYKMSRIMDMEGSDASEKLELVSVGEGTDIVYVYAYKVEQNEIFTARLTERDYTITYIMSVFYDSVDVTCNADFFEAGRYEENWFVTTEKREYGVRAGLKDKVTVGGTREGDPSLLYGAANWTVSDWVADKDGLGDLSGFAMPREDITVRATCVINSHKVNFSRQIGVDFYKIKSINGKSAELYGGDEEGYTVPFGSQFDLDVRVEEGYSVGNFGTRNVPMLGEESGYESNATSKYETNMKFVLAFNEAFTMYIVGAKINNHTVTYFINVDYVHSDEDRLLSNYITFDESSSRVIDGLTYYLVDTINNENGQAFGTVEDRIFGQTIQEPLVDASEQRYSFGGWTRMSGDSAYHGETMPDADVWEYARLTLNSYNVAIAATVFNFENNTSAVNTANVKKTIEGGETTNYADGEFSERELLYYSEITLKRHDPKGYDFNEWHITTRGSTATFAVTDETEYGRIYTITSQTGRKYRYVVVDDDTVLVYLTEDSLIEAVFSIKKFTARTIDNTMVKSNADTDAGKFAKVYTFEYGSKLDLTYQYGSLLNSGKKIVDFVVATDSDFDNVSETLDADFNEDTLSYATQGTVRRTTSEEYVSDVYIKAVTEDINYKVFYTIYPAATSIQTFSGVTPITVQADLAGNPFYVKYGKTITLIDDVTTRQIATENGLVSDFTMYSCWYLDRSASEHRVQSGGVEGGAMTDTGVVEYRHDNARSHAYFSCYLVNLFVAVDGNLRINPTVRTTASYLNHFETEYTDIEAPSVGMDSRPVTKVEEEGFRELKTLRYIHLPDTITEIGESAFEGCSALLETGITDKIEIIGRYAYRGCSEITEVTIEESVYSIGEEAFANIKNLRTVNYITPANSLNLTNKLEVGLKPFNKSGAASEEGIKVFIGKNATMIPQNLFTGASDDMSSVLNGGRITELEFEDGGTAELTIISGAFAKTAIKELVLPERLNVIGERAFENCAELTFADMSPAGITVIDKQVFRNSSLEVVLLPETLTTIGEYAFVGCQRLTSVYYTNSDGVANIGTRAFGAGDGQNIWDTQLKRLTDVSEYGKDNGGEEVIRLKNLEKLGENAFYNCVCIKEVYLGGDKTDLGKNVFYGARKLECVNYDINDAADKYTSDSASFAFTYSLSCSLVISENVKSIPSYMFFAFQSVDEITVPATVKRIGKQAFGQMTDLSRIYFNADGEDYECAGDAEPFIGSGASDGMSVIFGSSVKLISAGLFARATGLRGATIPSTENYLIIGDNAFKNSGIRNITVPTRGGTVEIGSDAFGNTPLRSFTLDDNASVTFKVRALSSINSPALLNLSVMGTQMTSLWATLGSSGSGSSTFTVRKTATGVAGTLKGRMTTVKGNNGFTVDRENEFYLSGSSTVFEIASGATVHGLFSVGFGASVSTDNINFSFFHGIAYDKADFDRKNAISEYTLLRVSEISEPITFSSPLTVSAGEVQIGATADGTSGATVVFENNTQLTGSLLKIENGASVTAKRRFELDGRLTGTMGAVNGTDIVIANEVILNASPSSAFSGRTVRGLTVASGRTEIVGMGTNAYNYKIISGELNIAGDFEQSPTDGAIYVLNGTVLSVRGKAMLHNYYAETSSELEVMPSGLIRLVDMETRTDLNWTLTAKAYTSGNIAWEETRPAGGGRVSYSYDAVTYYGALGNAFDDVGISGLKVYTYDNLTLIDDISLNDGEIDGSAYDITWYFNGHGLSLDSGSRIKMKADITLVDADITSTGSVICGTMGNLVLRSGTVSAKDDAIDIYGSVTLNAGTTVTSTDAIAIKTQTGSVTVGGSVVAATYGIITMGAVNVNEGGSVESDSIGIAVSDCYSGIQTSVTVNVVGTVTAPDFGIVMEKTSGVNELRISGTVTASATNGIGVSIVGTDTGLSLAEHGTVTGGYGGVYVVYASNRGAKPIICTQNGSTVNGRIYGIYAEGKGVTRIYGDVNAASSREIIDDDDGRMFTGGVVIVNSDGGATVEIGSTEVGGRIANTGGDAILFVKHDFTNEGYDPNMYTDSFTVTSKTTVSGNISQIARAFYEGANANVCIEDTTLTGIQYRPISKYEIEQKLKNDDDITLKSCIANVFIDVAYKCAVLESTGGDDNSVVYISAESEFSRAKGRGFVCVGSSMVDINEIPASDVWIVTGDAGFVDIDVKGALVVASENGHIRANGIMNIKENANLMVINKGTAEGVCGLIVRGSVIARGSVAIDGDVYIEKGAEVSVKTEKTDASNGYVINKGLLTVSGASSWMVSGGMVAIDTIGGSFIKDISLLGGSLTVTISDYVQESVSRPPIFIVDNITVQDNGAVEITVAGDEGWLKAEDNFTVKQGAYTFGFYLQTKHLIIGDNGDVEFLKGVKAGFGFENDKAYDEKNGYMEARYKNSTVKFSGLYNGEENKIGLNGELSATIYVNERTIFYGKELIIAGTLYANASPFIESSKPTYRYPGLMVQADLTVKNNGRLVLNKEIGLGVFSELENVAFETRYELNIHGGCGIEAYGSSQRVSATQLNIEDGAWIYLEKGNTVGLSDIIDCQIIHDIGSVETVGNVYDLAGDLYGTVRTYCASHEMVTVAPTCGDFGYIGSKYEVRDRLSVGLDFVIKYDRSSFVKPTGNHVFAAYDKDSGKHVCTVCGLEEEHDYSAIIAPMMTLESYGEDYFYGLICSVCGDSHGMLVLDASLTEREFNEAGRFLRVSDGNTYAFLRLSAFGDGADTPMISKADGGVLMDGHWYYKVKAIAGYNDAMTYYVLFEHDSSGHYYRYDEASGKHLCIACGAENASAHTETAIVERYFYNGVEYKLVKKACTYDRCLDSDGAYYVTAASVTELTSKVSAATIGGYTFALTSTPSGAIPSGALFRLTDNGRSLYAYGVTVRKNGAVLSGNYILPVLYEGDFEVRSISGTNTVTSADGQPLLIRGIATVSELIAYMGDIKVLMGGSEYTFTASSTKTLISEQFTTLTTIDGVKYSVCELRSGTLKATVYVEHVCALTASNTTFGGISGYMVSSGSCSLCGETVISSVFNASARTVGDLRRAVSKVTVKLSGTSDIYRLDVREYADHIAASDIKEGVENAGGGVYYDIHKLNGIHVNNSALTTYIYLRVNHTDHKLGCKDGQHVCEDCGVAMSGTHTANKIVVGDDGFLLKVCSACGQGDYLIVNNGAGMSWRTITCGTVNSELNTMTISVSGINAVTREPGVRSFKLELAETNGSFYSLYNEELKVDGVAYTVAYVKLTLKGWRHYHLYKALVPHKCKGNWKPNPASGATGHVCADCGLECGDGDEAHTMNGYKVSKYLFSSGREYTVITKCCNFCMESGDPYTDSVSRMSTANVNIQNLNGIMSEDGTTTYNASISYSGTNTHPASTGNAGSVTFQNKTYYLWRVTLTDQNNSSNTRTDVYALIARASSF